MQKIRKVYRADFWENRGRETDRDRNGPEYKGTLYNFKVDYRGIVENSIFWPKIRIFVQKYDKNSNFLDIQILGQKNRIFKNPSVIYPEIL